MCRYVCENPYTNNNTHMDSKESLWKWGFSFHHAGLRSSGLTSAFIHCAITLALEKPFFRN